MIYRLGDDLTVRLPRRSMAAVLVEHEQRVLPEFAERLPIAIPAPVRVGRPALGYPWSWSVNPWLPGTIAATTPFADAVREARRLGEFLGALHVTAPADAPPNPYRGHFIGENTPIFTERVERLAAPTGFDADAVLRRWHELVDVAPYVDAPRWIHGDLHALNVLVDEGSISAVIDFGDVCAGDPATDLSAAWGLFDADARASTAGSRGRRRRTRRGSALEAWALHFAVVYLVESADHPTMGPTRASCARSRSRLTAAPTETGFTTGSACVTLPSDVPRPVVSARSLVKRFGEFTAVAGIDVEIAPGEAFGFLGPNGAGKTSTMRMIGCVSPVTDGELRIFGLDPTTDGRTIRGRMGVVPQLDQLDSELTVVENLLIYGRYFDLSRAQCRTRADELIDFVQLDEKRGSKVDSLSGGQKRRVSIARSLINDPELLLLDEPTTGLDPQARHVLWDRLYQLKERGATQVITTHFMDEAEQLCDRLVVMDGGLIVAEGSPRGLIHRARATRGPRGAVRVRAQRRSNSPALDGVGQSDRGAARPAPDLRRRRRGGAVRAAPSRDRARERTRAAQQPGGRVPQAHRSDVDRVSTS